MSATIEKKVKKLKQPKIEIEDDLENEQFINAHKEYLKVISDKIYKIKLSDRTKLDGLYNQSINGDCNTTCTSDKYSDQSKHKEWLANKGKTKKQSMDEYVAMFNKIYETLKEQTQEQTQEHNNIVIGKSIKDICKQENKTEQQVRHDLKKLLYTTTDEENKTKIKKMLDEQPELEEFDLTKGLLTWLFLNELEGVENNELRDKLDAIKLAHRKRCIEEILKLK